MHEKGKLKNGVHGILPILHILKADKTILYITMDIDICGKSIKR